MFFWGCCCCYMFGHTFTASFPPFPSRFGRLLSKVQGIVWPARVFPFARLNVHVDAMFVVFLLLLPLLLLLLLSLSLSLSLWLLLLLLLLLLLMLLLHTLLVFSFTVYCSTNRNLSTRAPQAQMLTINGLIASWWRTRWDCSSFFSRGGREGWGNDQNLAGHWMGLHPNILFNL